MKHPNFIPNHSQTSPDPSPVGLPCRVLDWERDNGNLRVDLVRIYDKFYPENEWIIHLSDGEWSGRVYV